MSGGTVTPCVEDFINMAKGMMDSLTVSYTNQDIMAICPYNNTIQMFPRGYLRLFGLQNSKVDVIGNDKIRASINANGIEFFTHMTFRIDGGT